MSSRALLVDEGATHESLSGSTQAALALAVVAVVAIAGVMSGLTLGLLTLDRLDLELMMRTGTKKQHKFAVRLMPMVNNPHWVLATLVICNTAASMALPLCLDRLVNVAIALVLSTTAIVLFGEILPQAVCSRYGLSIGGYTAPVVRLLMWFTAPISWPIGKALDAILGKENFTFGKRQIRALVDLHRESTGLGGPLNEEEFHVIQGVLDLGRKKGYKAMTPLEKVFMLSTDDVIDRPTLQRILATGHSRIPVYQGSNRQHIIGLILVKELLAVVGLAQPASGPVPVKSLKMRDLPALPVDTPMTDLLNLFQTGHSHMALLVDQPGTKGSTEYRRASSIKQGRTSSASGGPISSIDSSFSSSSSDHGSDSDSSSSSSSGSSVSGDSETRTPRTPRTPRSPKSGPVVSLLQCMSMKKKKHRNKKLTAQSDAASVPDGAVQHDQQPGTTAAAAAGDQVVIEMGPVVSAVTAADDSACVTTAVAVAEATVVDPISVHRKTPVASSDVAAAAAANAVSTAAGVAVAAAAARKQAHSAVADAAVATDGSSGAAPVGIITLEDVLEELMQEEIVDETDAFIDNEKTCRVNARVLAMSLPPGMRRLIMASQLSQQQLRQQQIQQIQQQQGLAGSPPAHNSSIGAATAAGAAAVECPSEGEGVRGCSSSNGVVASPSTGALTGGAADPVGRRSV